MFRKYYQPKVIPFSQYFPNIESMNTKQRQFYEYWKSNMVNGNYIDLDGNVSYAFVYIYEILSSNNPKKIIEDLSRFLAVYKGDDVVPKYCASWISDSYVCLGNVQKARETYGEIPINAQAAYQTDRLLSLKVALGEDVAAGDVLTLLGPQVTTFAKENLVDIEKYIDITLTAGRESEARHFLKEWLPQVAQNPMGYSVYLGTVYSKSLPEVPEYSFSRSDAVTGFIKELTREAENSFREERGIPKVGEGWIAETNLFYEIKKAFSANKVIHHARPAWLGRQHLDILIEDLAVAIEYQGQQHDKPVAFFGGEEAYLANVRRDRRKKSLCTKNGVRLIYVREGYSLPDLISEINSEQD